MEKHYNKFELHLKVLETISKIKVTLSTAINLIEVQAWGFFTHLKTASFLSTIIS
jgi:hypothetical protein